MLTESIPVTAVEPVIVAELTEQLGVAGTYALGELLQTSQVKATLPVNPLAGETVIVDVLFDVDPGDEIVTVVPVSENFGPVFVLGF